MFYIVIYSDTWQITVYVYVFLYTYFPFVTSVKRMFSNTVILSQSSEAAEGCVTVKYSLAGQPSQNQLHFSLTPAEDTG